MCMLSQVNFIAHIFRMLQQPNFFGPEWEIETQSQRFKVSGPFSFAFVVCDETSCLHLTYFWSDCGFSSGQCL